MKYIQVLRFAAEKRRLRSHEFIEAQELRDLYPGDPDVETKIGYLIGYLRKKGWLRTVSRSPPAVYEVTEAGMEELKSRGVHVQSAGASLDEYITESTPSDRPSIVGLVEGVGLNSVSLRVKGCPVVLRASAGIIGHILANDMLRQRVRLWLANNEVIWVERHEF